MSDSKAVLETREKIRRWLTDRIHGVGIDGDGDLHFRHGSARIWVTLRDLPGDEGDTVVEVFAPVLLGVPPSADLYEWVARSMARYRFGTFYVVDSSEGDGSLDLLFRITLLGTYIDPPEFQAAYEIVATTADNLDDELQERFGGERFHDEGDD